MPQRTGSRWAEAEEPDFTLRQLVEDFAAEHGVAFLPKPGRSERGLQVTAPGRLCASQSQRRTPLGCRDLAECSVYCGPTFCTTPFNALSMGDAGGKAAVPPPVQVWGFGGVSIIMDVSTQLIRAQVSRQPWDCVRCAMQLYFETARFLSPCAHHLS